ncbi:MAG: hypothetical protein OXH83_06315, partial [Bryobacterales bacterium]|nr:hypothetical protein [Bryobacterales bacterium]
ANSYSLTLRQVRFSSTLPPGGFLPGSNVLENRIDIVTEPSCVLIANGVEFTNDWISPCSLHDQTR